MFKNYFLYIKESLSLDYRSLGLYRILLGFIVVIDVIYRLPDLRVFYTDQGILPRSVFLTDLSLPWSFSFHLANGSMIVMLLFFLFHFISGLMLMIGYKTQLAVFLSWLMTISVHNRNWLINNGGDDILRSILFLSIFLPLGKRFSVDSLGQKCEKKSFFSFWTLAFFFQVFAIYFFSYILKDHAIWRQDYTALRYASFLDIFATPFGVIMRSFPGLQKILTIYTVFLEWLGPILLVFCGFLLGKRWWIGRSLNVILFWFLHFGIIFCMYIGVFPYLCLSIWCALIPSMWWDKKLDHLINNKFLTRIQKVFLILFPPKESKENKRLYFLYESFGALIFFSLLSWNLHTTKKMIWTSSHLNEVVRWLHMYQEWNMFAPYPKLDNIWLEVPATLEDGSQLELITGLSDIYSIKNKEFISSIKNEHWRKLYLNFSENVDYLKYYGSFLCREWNQFNQGLIPGKKLRKMEFIIFSQANLLSGEHGPVQIKHSWKHWCFEQDMMKETTLQNTRRNF